MNVRCQTLWQFVLANPCTVVEIFLQMCRTGEISFHRTIVDIVSSRKVCFEIFEEPVPEQ